MTTPGEPARTSGFLRRRWPLLALLSSVTFVALAILLAGYLDGRIVLIGPIDAVKVEISLGVVAVWCLAACVIGSVLNAAPGRFTGLFVRGVVVPAIVLGAFALSAIVGVLLAFRLGVDPRYELDVPEGSPRYIVSTFTFGETSLNLYRSDSGVVYERVTLALPYADRRTSFASSHRVETDGTGQSFLVYRQEGGEEARVPLPDD